MSVRRLAESESGPTGDIESSCGDEPAWTSASSDADSFLSRPASLPVFVRIALLWIEWGGERCCVDQPGGRRREGRAWRTHSTTQCNKKDERACKSNGSSNTAQTLGSQE